MDVLTLLLLLALIGVVAWALTHYLPMTPGMARLIQIAAVVIGALILLRAFGLWPANLGSVPQIR